MIWLLYIAAAALVPVCIRCWRVAFDFGPNDTAGFIGGMVTGLAILVLGIVPTVILPLRAVGRTTCRNFAAQTGYPTKFVVLNWADTGTCLARTPDGHWTKNTNIIVNVPAVKP